MAGRPPKYDKPLKPTSFRISPKHLFALRFVARQGGISDASALEETIERMADEVKSSRHWVEMWDEEESVRMLNLFALPEYKPAKVAPRGARKSLAESELRAFCFAHAQFFWADKARTTPKRPYAVVLWPHIEELAETWKKKRDEDYHVAAKAMTALLRKAKLEPPAFG